MAVVTVHNKALICGQCYKQFALVTYESRVVIWGIFKSGTTLESLFTSINCL